jgi:hypothetical protein
MAHRDLIEALGHSLAKILKIHRLRYRNLRFLGDPVNFVRIVINPNVYFSLSCSMFIVSILPAFGTAMQQMLSIID